MEGFRAKGALIVSLWQSVSYFPLITLGFMDRQVGARSHYPRREQEGVYWLRSVQERHAGDGATVLDVCTEARQPLTSGRVGLDEATPSHVGRSAGGGKMGKYHPHILQRI